MSKSYTHTYTRLQSWSESNYWGKAPDIKVATSSSQKQATVLVDSFSITSRKGNFRAPNSHSWSYTKRQYLTGSMSGLDRLPDYGSYVDYQSSSLSGPLFGANDGLSDLDTTAGNDTYNSALSRLNDKTRGSLNLAVDALEIRSTGRMLNLLATAEQAILTLHRVRKDVLRGKLAKKLYSQGSRRLRQIEREYRGHLKVGGGLASSAHLQATFGWGPLLSSIYGAADELLRLKTQSPGVMRFKGRAKSSRTRNFEIQRGHPFSSSAPGAYVGVDVQEQHSTEICVYMMCDSGLDLRRWTSFSPLTVGYELLPYSWIVDYFWNLGGYLQDLETALLYRTAFAGGYVTTMTHVNAQNYITRPLWRSGPVPFSVSGNGFLKYGTMTRKVLTNYPFPDIPRPRFDLGAGQALNIAALATQLLSSPKRDKD